MKLDLNEKQGIQLLQPQGEISVHDAKVLKAGISKLLREGKNKIIIELNEVISLDQDVLREISQLNQAAQELSGKVALAGVQDSDLQQKIESFSQPPVLQHFTSSDDAIEKLNEAGEESTEESEGEVGELKQQIRDLKEQLKQKESDAQINELQREASSLKAENEKLKEQIQTMMLEREEPPNKKAYDEKIQLLESKLEKALAQAGEEEKGSGGKSESSQNQQQSS